MPACGARPEGTAATAGTAAASSRRPHSGSRSPRFRRRHPSGTAGPAPPHNWSVRQARSRRLIRAAPTHVRSHLDDTASLLDGPQRSCLARIPAGPHRLRSPSCACHADPDKRHGPYWQHTSKIRNKTVTRRLTPAQAALYQEWIANERALRDLLAQMQQISDQARPDAQLVPGEVLSQAVAGRPTWIAASRWRAGRRRTASSRRRDDAWPAIRPR